MNLSDDFIRHELRSLAPQNMTRSRSQSTDSVNESVKSTINETKQSIYIDEILQDDIGHTFFCLSCCFKFEDSTSFLRHFGQHHLNQVKLTYSQEQFLKHNSFEYHFLSILIDFRIKSKFLRKYSHALIVLNEETAFMLDELNKEENEEDDSDPSDKELSVHDENNFYDSRPKLSLLFVDFSIIKSGRIFSYLKDLFVKSYPVFKNSNEARKEVALSDDIDQVKESNENKNPKKTSSQVFHSRNACKKLKCPKCNWHYKYRETLDIHMKEKHSTDLSQTMSQQCVYCIENIQHPRLGRGEQYKCGYKPYRCDICDYSTTTKGNLSIHMQSDKHVNNLKEIGSKSQEKSEAKEVESNDIRSIDLNRKFVNKKYLNSKKLAGNLPQDHSNNSLTTTSNKSKSILPQTEIDISLLCPLCYIGFNQQILLENHLKESHCVVNEDTIKNLLKTGLKIEQNKTMKTSSDDEFINTNQENDFEMNVDNNQADLDLFIDNLINKHNDILDTLLSDYLFKNRHAYTQLLGNLLGPSHTVIVHDNSDNKSTTLVQCADCSRHSAKFANLTDFKHHLVETHDHQPLQLNQSLLHTCLDHFAKASTNDLDELKRFLVSHNHHLATDSIHHLIARLTLNRMNKTFTLNKPPAAKLAFSAESLLNNQPSTNTTAQNQLLTYFKSTQMTNGTQPLFNQFFLPFMLSSSTTAAAAVPGPGSPPDDDQLDESLELSGGSTTPGAINRRRRTRITEQQLKILRQYFDINKSPSDDQVADIARQTQLQAKVIKHWFRNTLFKERQKDKDSPYNFNNPPLTQLNLEEYEKTGKVVSEPAAPPLANSLNESTTESNETSEHLNVDMDETELEATITSSRCSSVGAQKHRPNRTKFSEAQSKALSAAFKHQKYPKDEQISQLSAQLGLKPRVITVWFQNARQKARKSTAVSNGADDPNDYYDLNDDECDEIHSHVSSSTDKSSAAADPTLAFAASNKALQLQLAMSLLAAHQHQQQMQHGDKLTSSSSSSAASSSSSSSSSKKDDDDDESDEDDDEDGDETDSAANVVKSDSVTAAAESAVNKSGSAKRLRTTILPEQQEFLMQKYQLDQNPSRKMLDEIAKQVRLKKRVVQVWFQNTRARERKGIIKVASPVCAQSSAKCTKKCTLCSLTFRCRNDLESHLILKHNFSFEQATSSLKNTASDTDTTATTNSNTTTPSNGLNSILMSTLFAQLQQQQQQQPFDLSFKAKVMSRENGAERSRTNSDSGSHKVNTLSQKQAVHMSNQQQQQQQQQRRVRTQMTQYQVNVMRLIFAEYKTPTMNECELMGKEINLKKRVVQVWFQNARAKEKKNAVHKSILFSNSANNDLSNFEFANDQCLLCGVKYSSNSSTVSQQQREHLFSKHHLNKLVQFVTKLAMDNGANSVDFSAKSAAKIDDDDDDDDDDHDDDSELDDDANTDDDHDHNESSHLNESHESKPPPSSSSSFDINRLLQMPSQTAPNCQLYNYFLYSNLLAQQPKVAANSSASSDSSSSASPPFYPQIHNPMLAQLYAAFAAQHHAQTSATLDSLNVAKSVQADIEKQLSAPPPGPHTVRYTVDGSTRHDLINKHSVDAAGLDEHTQATQYVCRACKSVSPSRDVLLAHQCSNPPLNKSLAHANLVKLEQIAYKCVACAAEAHADSVFASAADFLQHLNSQCSNGKRKEHHVHVDSNNNKKIKY